MASSIQLLRSTNPQERPFAGNLLEGQPAANLHSSEPGLFFKTTDGSVVKFGPAAITSDGSPPNSSPQGSSGNSIGELWLDKSVDPAVLKVYDGSAWVDAGSGGGGGGGGSAAFVRWIYTAIGGETSLSGSSGGAVLDYTAGLEEVYVNGVLITRGIDYSATNGTSITNLSPLQTGDVVTVLSMNPVDTVQLPGQVTLLRWTVLATAGQTVLSGIDSSGQQLAYSAGFEEVYVNGAFLRRGIDYVATDGLTITGLSPLAEDDEITVLAWTPFTVSTTIINADVAPNANISSSKLAYIAPGSSVSRTLTNKLSEEISVLDFIPTSEHSAIIAGTSSYDCTANLQAAIDTGRSLYFPKGTYTLASGGLEVDVITGASYRGDNAELLGDFSVVNGAIFDVKGTSSYISISGLTFKTNADIYNPPSVNPITGGGIDTPLDGLKVSGSYVKIQDCFSLTVNKGFHLVGGDHIILTNCFAKGTGRYGVGVIECNDVVVSNNAVEFVTGNYSNAKFADGIYIYASQDVVCSGNVVHDVRRILIVLEENTAIAPGSRSRNKNVLVEGNNISYARESIGTEFNAGIWVEPTCADESCVLSGNSVYDCGPLGIYANSGVLVRGNLVDGSAREGTGTSYGIDLTDGIFRVFGNTVRNCSTAGIRVRSEDSAIIVDNRLLNNAIGLRMDATTLKYKATVAGNHFEDNTTHGIGFRFDDWGDLGNTATARQITTTITDNTFYSSCDSGNTTSNQPYGLKIESAVCSSEFFSSVCLVKNNTFNYTGTITSSNATTPTMALVGTAAKALPDNFSTKASPRASGEVWVTDFGAVAGTDDSLAPANTQAFLAAIDTGLPVRIPAGEFRVNSMDVTGKANTLVMTGAGETIVKRVGGGATFYSSSTMTLNFRGFVMDGNGTGSSIHWDYGEPTGRNRFDDMLFRSDEYGLNIGCLAVSWTITNSTFNGLTYARKFAGGAWACREFGNYTWFCVKGLWVQQSGFSNSVLSSVFEYNSQEAVIIEGNVAAGAEIGDWLFESVFFEANANTTAAPIIDIRTSAAHRIRCVTFDNCYFTIRQNATYICQITAGGTGSIDKITFRNNSFNAAGLPVTNSNSSRVIFENNNYFSDAYGASFSTNGIRDANLWPVTVPYGNKGRVFPSQNAAPSTPNPGETYFDTSTNKLRCWDGTTWNDLF